MASRVFKDGMVVTTGPAFELPDDDMSWEDHWYMGSRNAAMTELETGRPIEQRETDREIKRRLDDAK